MAAMTSNVLRKSNVFPRLKGRSLWEDAAFLKKIEDVRQLCTLYDEFKKGDPNRNLRALFTDEQIALMKCNTTCRFAPAGVRTYGFTAYENNRGRKLVCRCPYAADPARKSICGAAWDDCHSRYEEVQYNPADFEPVMIPSQVIESEEPPIPPSPVVSAAEETASENPATEIPDSETPSSEETVSAAADVIYPEKLDLVYGGFEIKGISLLGGYEVRITSGGAFVANVTCNGVAWGNHSKLSVRNVGSDCEEASFGDNEKLKLTMDRENSRIEVLISGLILKIPVK